MAWIGIWSNYSVTQVGAVVDGSGSVGIVSSSKMWFRFIMTGGKRTVDMLMISFTHIIKGNIRLFPHFARAYYTNARVLVRTHVWCAHSWQCGP